MVLGKKKEWFVIALSYSECTGVSGEARTPPPRVGLAAFKCSLIQRAVGNSLDDSHSSLDLAPPNRHTITASTPSPALHPGGKAPGENECPVVGPTPLSWPRGSWLHVGHGGHAWPLQVVSLGGWPQSCVGGGGEQPAW